MKKRANSKLIFFLILALGIASLVHSQETPETDGPAGTEIVSPEEPSGRDAEQPAEEPTAPDSGATVVDETPVPKKKPDKNNPVDKKKKTAKNIVPKKGPEAPRETKKTFLKSIIRAPEDPSFLYDNRFIPGLEYSGEFLDKEMEKEVIVEQIKDKKKYYDVSIKMPDLVQTLVAGGIVFIFILYRMQVRKKSHRRR